MTVFDKVFGRREPPPKSLQSLLQGYRISGLLFVAARLGLADLLAVSPAGAEELAMELHLHAPSLHRLLRGLAAVDVLDELADGRFALAPLGQELRSGADGAAAELAILCGEEYFAAWGQLLHGVTTGAPGFDAAFGETVWEHRRKHPELNENFQDWLRRGAALTGHAIAESYDFSKCRTVADLGGGRGALLIALLKAHPRLQGVLFDNAHVLDSAQSRIESEGLASRCRVVEGDIFHSVPVQADLFILKSVLHDWNDDQGQLLLANCRAALRVGQSLLVIERLLPERAAEDPDMVMQDLHMLAVTGGKERTAKEYAALFAAAGLAQVRTTALGTGHTLFEVKSLA